MKIIPLINGKKISTELIKCIIYCRFCTEKQVNNSKKNIKVIKRKLRPLRKLAFPNKQTTEVIKETPWRIKIFYHKNRMKTKKRAQNRKYKSSA
jgi:hypothetical protein